MNRNADQRADFARYFASVALVVCILSGPACHHRDAIFLTSPGPLAPTEELELALESVTEPETAESVREGEIPYLKLARDAEAQALRALGEERDPPPDELVREGGAVKLSLEQVRAATLRGNLDLRVIVLDPQIAWARTSEEVGRFEATFQAALQHRRLDSPPFSVEFGGAPDLTSQRFERSLALPLYSGGVVSMEEGLFRLNPIDPNSDSVYDGSLGFRWTQPLLRGAGFAVATAPIQVAELQGGLVDANTRFNAILLLAEADRAYWRLYVARRLLQVTQEQLELASRQVGASKRLAEARVLPRVETLRSESGLQLRADAYIRAETLVRLQARNLKRIMQHPDLPFWKNDPIVLATEPKPIGFDLDSEVLVERALQNRMDLLTLQFQRDILEVQIGVERNSVLPQLQMEFFAKLLGTGASGGEARNELLDGDFNDVFVSLSTEFPIFGNRSARSRLRQARLEAVRTELAEGQLVVAIQQQVLDALDQVDQNWQRILAARRAVDATLATYKAEVRLFELGQRSGDLVLFAAEQLSEAQTLEIQALGDYEESKIELAEATGTLLGYNNIAWLDPEEAAAIPHESEEIPTPPSNSADDDAPEPGELLQ